MSEGIAIQFEVNDKVILKEINRLIRKRVTMTPIFAIIGEMVLTQTKEHFLNEESPWGVRWAALQPNTAKAKLRRGGKVQRGSEHILRASGRLFYSLTPSRAIKSGPLHVEVGTNVRSEKGFPYPIAQQTGTRRGVPARPWLGLNDTDILEVGAFLAREIAK